MDLYRLAMADWEGGLRQKANLLAAKSKASKGKGKGKGKGKSGDTVADDVESVGGESGSSDSEGDEDGDQ